MQDESPPARRRCVVASAPVIVPISFPRQAHSLRTGRVDAVVATADSLETTDAAVLNIGRWTRTVRQADGLAMIVRGVADIEEAKAAGATSIILQSQGSERLRGPLDPAALPGHTLGG